jgi:hypothetical protein
VSIPLPPGARLYCTGVYIDDECDGCGQEGKGRRGVIFGVQGQKRPVLCSHCIRRASVLLNALVIRGNG